MQLDVRADLKQAERYLQNLRKEDIPFATAYALTKTAQAAQRTVVSEMKRVFDRPKPFTLNGTYVKPATKRDLRALVKLKDGYLGEHAGESRKGTVDKYLAAQVKGGTRRPKAFEKLLINRGLMPPGMYAVPTSSAPLDPYGNVSAGYFNRVMSQLAIATDSLTNVSAASRKRRRTRTTGFFVAYPGREKTKHLAPGIYERIGVGFGKAIRPIFIYTDNAPRYRVRLPFDQIVMRTVRRDLNFYFEQGFRYAQAIQGTKGDPVATTSALFAAGLTR
jgi:hypothetical protein